MPKINKTRTPGVYLQPSVVSGKSWEDIIKISPNELQTMDAKELRQLTQRLISVANKRIKRMGDIKEKSPAWVQAQKTGLLKDGKFSMKTLTYVDRDGNKQTRSMLTMFNALSGFLQKETSTVAGTKKLVKKLTTDLNRRIKMSDVPDEELDKKYSEVWKHFLDYFPWESQIAYKYRSIGTDIREEISKHPGESSEEIFDRWKQDIIKQLAPITTDEEIPYNRIQNS